MELPEHKDQDCLGYRDVCEVCPVCKKATDNLGLNSFLQTFELCHCTKTNLVIDGHWVRVTWHRDCYLKCKGWVAPEVKE